MSDEDVGYFFGQDFKDIPDKVKHDVFIREAGYKVNRIISIKRLFADIFEVNYIVEKIPGC